MADPRPFMEIAAGFDPNLPADQYDAYRQKYFNDVILPRLGRGSSMSMALDRFMKNTERPQPTAMSRAILPVAQAASGFAASFMRPIGALSSDQETRRLAERTERAEQFYTQKAARYGTSQIPTYAGEIAGSLPAFALAEETAGMSLEAAVPGMAARMGEIAFGATKGGAAMASLEAIEAKDGERFTAGARGLAWGAGLGVAGALAWKGVGSLTTKLTARGVEKGAADEVARNHLSGEGPVNPVADQAIDEHLKDSQQASNAEGRAKNVWSNSKIQGVVVSGRTAAEGEAQPWVVRVQPGAEKAAAERVLEYTHKGGVVEDVIHHPDALETLNRYQQAMAEEHAERYKNARVEHAPGDAAGVASEMRIDGQAAEAVSPDHVLVQDPVRARPTDREIDDAIRQLKKPDPDNPGEELELTKADRLLMRKSVKALWDTDIPDEAKEQHAQLLSHWELGDMIPSKWRRTKAIPEMADVLPGETPQPAAKRIWEMSYEELEAAEQADKAKDQQMLEEFFGKEGARRYTQAQRRGADLADEMESQLTEEQRNRLFGIGETGPTWEDYREFRQSLGAIEGETPEELGSSMRWAITGMGDIRDPALMTREQQMRYAQLRHGFETAERMGWDKNAVLESALRGATERFGPDAEFMLRQFLKPSGEAVERTRPQLGVGEEVVQSKSRQNVYQEIEPLLRRDEPREFLESAPPELRQALRSDLHIPESERYSVERDPAGGIRRVAYATGEVLERGPLHTTLRVGAEGTEKLFAGRAVEGSVDAPGQLRSIANILGLPLPSEFGAEQPVMILTPNATEMTETHEGMHIFKHTVPALGLIMEGEGRVVEEIGSGLKSRSPLYAQMRPSLLNEEAFVYAATSIMHGDAQGLAELVRMDGSLDDVLGMVRERASGIHDALRWDGVDGAPERIIQRQMEDLLRRTTSKEEGDLAWELMHSAEDELKDYRYDPASRRWIENSHGQERMFSSKKEMLDDIAKRAAGKDWAPSATLWAEERGARGPIAPRNGGPIKNPPVVDEPPPEDWSWWKAFDQWIRPMGPWVADLHKQINDALKPFGKKLDLYNPFKDVDDAVRAKAQWMEPVYNELASALKGAGKKQFAYLDLLAEDPKHWETMAEQYQLSSEDLPKIRKLGELVDKLDAQDPEMKIRDFITRDWKNLRSSGRDVGAFFDFDGREASTLSPIERMIKSGRLDPRVRHAGAFMNKMIREIGNRKFTDEPLQKFEALINRTAKNGKPLFGSSQKTLQRYVDYMRNIPDESAEKIQKTLKNFLEFTGRQIAKVNRLLPAGAQLPTDLGLSQDWINRMIAWSYAAGIGMRAIVPVRDALQTFVTVLPVLGPARYARGMARGMTREGWNFAEENGALLGHRTVAETYGDIIDEIPRGSRLDKITEFANKIMAPSRWGHNVGRSIAFNGEYGDALDAVVRYRRGEVTFDELKHRDNTSLWWTDEAFQDRIKGQLEDRGGFTDHEVARNMAHEVLDLTLWPYRRGMQPSMLQTGAGRLFGQYGLWPANYLDFARRGLSKVHESGSKWSAMQAIAMWGAVNYAGSNAMNAMGIDGSKIFWAGAGLEPGPTGQLVLNLGKSFANTAEGRDARRQVAEFPKQFIPTSVFAESVWDAIESGQPLFDGNGHPTPEAVKLFGFTPLKANQRRDLEDQVLYEFGYSRTKAGAIRSTLVERERPAIQ